MAWSGAFNTRFTADTLTANRTYTLPDKDGVVMVASAGVLEVDRLSASSVFANVATISAIDSNLLTLHRLNAVNEGGQVTFRRASDDTEIWSIDAFGTENLRFIHSPTSTVPFFLTGGVSASERMTFDRDFSGGPTGARFAKLDMTYPATRGLNQYFGFVFSAADTLVDGSALIVLQNNGNADGMYVGCKGLTAGATTPTGIGIDVNRSASGESNSLNAGIGMQIWNWSTTLNNASYCLLLNNQAGGNNVLATFKNSGDNRAINTFQAGATTDQQEGFFFLRFGGTAQYSLVKQTDNSFVLHDNILSLDVFAYDASAHNIALLPNGGGGSLLINRSDANVEGGQIVFRRALDNESQFGIDCFGSGSVTTGISLRIFNSLAGGALYSFGLNGQFSAPTVIASNTIYVAGSATSAAANQINMGGLTTVSASAGGGASLPATTAGFWVINVAGTQRKVPFYAA